MKKILSFLLILFFVVTNLNIVLADEIPENVHIGLVSQQKNYIEIKNKKLYVSCNESFLNCEFDAEKNFSVSIAKKFYINTEKFYFTYNDALSAKKNYTNSIVYLNESGLFSIYVGSYENLENAQFANINLNGKIVSPEQNKLILSADEKNVLIFDSNCPQFMSNEFIQIGDRKYRGVIKFGVFDSQSITPINILPLEEYLYSVVPSEMYSFWPQEALKAQTVAARTYAINKMKTHAHKNCDLCDTVHCQEYLGITRETERVNKFIDETKNLCIYYKNKPIEALFFSSSGGPTENSENVFVTALDYLRSVPQINETARAWTREFKFSEIEKLLTDKKIYIGNVLGIQILSLLPSGRVNEMLIISTNGEKKLTGEGIKTFFAKTKNGSLESRFFEIQNTNDSIIFSGRGSGHGVGMSQYGAKGMAELGYDFIDILKYYYTGVEVR